MKKNFCFKKMALLFVGFIFSQTILAAENSGQPSWQIDKFMRFNIAYLPDKSAPIKSQEESIKPKAVLAPAFAPDITNINLAKFLEMGFDVPKLDHSENYNFYLKLYEFPPEMESNKITEKFISDFALNEIPNFVKLQNYITDKNNILIKLSYIDKASAKFSAANAMPILEVAKSPKFSDYFINHIPFYSLYLTPENPAASTSKDDTAKNSTAGVTNFYQNLIAVYKSNLQEVSGVDPKYFYFAPKKIDTDQKQITILKVPKQILIFANWHDLPMPQDPNKIFLTSLLLVYKTDYKLNSKFLQVPTNLPLIDSDKFKAIFIKDKTQILEVGSVVNF